MEPWDFHYTAAGLSEKYMIWIMSAVTIILFIYLLYISKKNGSAIVDGKFRPLTAICRAFKNNRGTISAIINKNLVGRYSNTYFGVLWNFLSPFLLVLAIFFIFVNIKGVYPERHYWTYICSGTFIVSMCRQSLSGVSFRSNSPIIKKLPNSPWAIAFADTVSSFVMCFIPYVVMFIVMAIRGVNLNITTFMCTPFLLIILFVFNFGLTTLFSTITILVGEVRQIMVTVSRIIIWISPVFFYLCDAKAELYQATMWNPFTYTVEPFHQAISYGVMPDLMLVGMSILIALFFLMLGLLAYVKKINRVRELI